MAEAASPGRTIGSTMWISTENGEAPSISAASSMSTGIWSMNFVTSHTDSGRPRVVFPRISAQYVSRMPSWLNVEYIVIMSSGSGKAMDARKNRSSAFL